MKLKQLSLMTIAAIYAGGVAAATSPITADNKYDKVSVDPFSMTAEQYQAIQSNTQNLMNRKGLTNGPNIHISNGQKISRKVPFQFENGISGEQTYIVQLVQQPVATYQGSISGFAATAPSINSVSKSSEKINIRGNATSSYVNFLEGKQQQVMTSIARVTGSKNTVLQSYKYGFNGLSLKLTQQQANEVSQLSGVRAVTRSIIQKLQTDVGPEHIGAREIWAGTATESVKYSGAGIIVGIIDTGINSDHPSFSAQGDDGIAIVNPLGSGNYVGDCQIEEFAGMCNDKLIGIHSYTEITDSYGDPAFKSQGWWAEWERARPANGEDYNGHGSHTASTVAGNILYNVPYQLAQVVSGDEQSPNEITGRNTDLVFPQVSGVAPHANIIAYQVCWAGGGNAPYSGCPQDVTLKAIDDAIADGVDVINFSIGGAEVFPWESPVELAFLAAREAGINVAASAGNAGYSWMDHVSPWLTSVAATNHGRILDSNPKQLEAFEGGDSVPTTGSISAASITAGYTGPVVLAEHYDVNNANCDTAFAIDTFTVLPNGDPLSEAPIVVCGRSDQPRVTKSDNVKVGGAGGFILYNTQSDYLYGDSLAQKVDDYYSLPAAHVGNYNGGQIKTWLETGTGHRLTITDSSLFVSSDEADVLADFSSRGPSTTNPNVMAPTLAAPGVDVFAAYANDRIFTLDGYGQNWAMISGTSMASPHVAGAMALIQNARPNWTAAEIQSALTTTTTTAYNFNLYTNSKSTAKYDDAGAGVISIASAVQASLVMHETVENYENANPLLGGDVSSLNTPYLVNRECEGSCTWFRTFKATASGTWTASAEEVGYEGASLMSLEVSPSQFTLAAGETQRVMVTATMPDIDFQSDSPLGEGNTNGQLFNGKLMLTSSNTNSPLQTLPIIAQVKKADLPVIIETTIGRDQGEYITQPMIIKDTAALSANVYGVIQGDLKQYNLKQFTVWPEDIVNSLPTEASQIGYRLFTVPEGTKRLVVEIAKEDDAAKFTSRIDLGRDVNADNLIDWASEAICISDWRKRDYCAINNPEPGQYWYMVSNLKWSNNGWWDPYDAAQEIVTNVVVISDEVTDKVMVPAISSDGVTPVELKLEWNLPSSMEADIYHGVIELGTDSANSDIGMFPIRLTRGESDVTLTSSHQGAKIGDVIDFEVVHQANMFGGDRDINIQVTLPDGLTLDPSSVRGNEFAQALIGVEGNQLTIAGLQPSSKDSPRSYVYTTSLDDEMCRLPFSDAPEYVDLPGIGVQQLPGFTNTYDQLFEIPDYIGADNYFPHIPLYGVEAKDATNIISIFGNGRLHQDAHALFSMPGYTLGLDGLKDLVIAPFWRANSVTLNESGMDFATFTPYQRGVYAASLNQGKFLATEWKEMYNATSGWFGPEVDRSQSFSFQTIASSVIDFTPGVYEIFFSYKELNGDKGEHSIGLKGYQGVRGFYYPVNGYNYDDFAINEPEKFDSNMIVCANYQGPESTRLVTRFSALVNSDAAASINDVMMSAEVSGGDTVEQKVAIDVASSITVFDLANMTLDENTASNEINVEFMHNGNRTVTMEVSGDNLSASVNGMSFMVSPTTDWYGESEVTVSVYDVANPQDSASTTFMLTVNSDGIELGCTDSAANNFNASANTNDDSCSYTETATKKSSGGPFSWLLILLMPVVLVRRKLH